MARDALHRSHYKGVPDLLRAMRKEAGMTTRDLGEAIGRPQSWVTKCETRERRVDVAEFCLWCKGCDVDPAAAIRRFVVAAR